MLPAGAGEVFWLPEPPQSLPLQADGDPVGACTWPSEICDTLPPAGVVVAAVFVAGTPSVASQPHGSVIVTAVGVVSQTVHCLVVTVKPLGIWLVPGVHVGVASVQLSVTVYVAGTIPVGQSER